ncbi:MULTISPECIES: hut operon transcriptional regulator HutP [unclassified Paenibacillus]|jgi:hut operon positive regulator|uniref:hut operon transcriptional regulator HutP n=1 Tax=unclassified Paenibacillus TaxID=185978 RepID=UPI00278A409E|nr:MULTISPECIES: hut operon transcriptional regulator HutP [unclassified Paenibacillus]MDF2645604.1 transcriptional regulator [Paenibacillus sp.]MDQ0897839.1 hut operon positive regulator [Paenibacillus sp. V4I7]MDQ0916165.1 hut operon positive regulator [Paenibacillus sp. V4I5]
MTSPGKTPFPIGKLSMLLAVLRDHSWNEDVENELKEKGYRYVVGKVGAMDLNKVIAAIETTAKNNHIINKDIYHEVHALYHAIIEALQGVGRGMVQFGDILRTVGLTFSIVRGKLGESSEQSGEWIAVSIYGTIGAPKKGFEHEAFGYGFNHI